MSTEISVALITGAVSILTSLITLTGVVISNSRSKRDMQQRLEIAQAVTDTKIDELTREVRQHNNFAQRVPVVEEQLKVVNHRIKIWKHFTKEAGQLEILKAHGRAHPYCLFALYGRYHCIERVWRGCT